MMRLVVIIGVITSLGCGEESIPLRSLESHTRALSENTVEPIPKDAGDEAFVKRLIPYLWGRRPLSINEVDVLVQMAGQMGREKLVRTMAKHPDYRDRWGRFMRDIMAVARMGYYANASCYGRKTQAVLSTDIAKHVRDKGPKEFAAEPFTIADLIESALLLDDVSPVMLANLPAWIYRALDDQNFLAAFGQRQNRAEIFMRHYLNRRLTCMGCHNSEQSITDSTDPEQDRHWPIPCNLEKNIFGNSSANDFRLAHLSPFFRRKGVIVGYYYTKEDEGFEPGQQCNPPCDFEDVENGIGIFPWGWDLTCGFYFNPDETGKNDAADVSPFFITHGDKQSSSWHLVQHLQSGFDKLRGEGLNCGDDGNVDGQRAFAYMVSMTIAERVWEAAFGHTLTLVHYFPRNRWQRDILWNLTESFVNGGFSMVDLIVSVVTHPYFNGAAPAEGEEAAPYRPVFDAYAEEDKPIEERRNHLGHTVHRADARILLKAAYTALGWPRVPEYLFFFMEPAAQVHRNVGTYLKTGEPGFVGTSMQSTLSWEALYGLCQDASVNPVCPLMAILDLPEGQLRDPTVCELCENRVQACEWDARCCDIPWEQYCGLDYCLIEGTEFERERIFLEYWPKLDPPANGDFIVKLLAQANGNAKTLGELVSALKDRLLNDPSLDGAGEQKALETLLGAALDSPADDPKTEERLRLACGTFLATPQFMLMGWPGADRVGQSELTFTPAGSEFKTLCESLGSELFGEGEMQCAESKLNVPAGNP